MTGMLGVISTILIVALLAAAAQEYRYFRTRRNIVHDQQDLFHSSSAFHTATLVALSPEQDLLIGVGDYVKALERNSGSVVYAGKIAALGLISRQLPASEWDAFILTQYPSREAYEAAAKNPELDKARSAFASAYTLGMKRPRAMNLALPVVLLARRAVDIVRRHPSRYPFERADIPDDAPPEAQALRGKLIEGLLSNREYGSEAIVILNYAKNGNTDERKANAGYGNEMLAIMAEMGMGPMHFGRAVTLEGDADFDDVILVYYPGVEFFSELVQSKFYTGIAGGKQLNDTQSTITVPLLPHL